MKRRVNSSLGGPTGSGEHISFSRKPQEEIERRAFVGRCGRWCGGVFLFSCLGSVVACGCGKDTTSDGDTAGSEFYLGQKNALVKQAEDFSKGLEATMTSLYGAREAGAIASGMVGTYEGILEKIPYIGGDSNPLTDILIECSISMAFCMTMRDHGKSFDDAGRINYETIAQSFQENPLPPDQRYVPGDLEQKREEASRFAQWTQDHEKDYPGDWVARFVADVPKPFTYGTDYVQCGNLKLCEKLGIPKFAPYICMLDSITYRARGEGLTRTATLADGGSRCDFRFSEDGVVKLEEPFTVRKLREWGVET